MVVTRAASKRETIENARVGNKRKFQDGGLKKALLISAHARNEENSDMEMDVSPPPERNQEINASKEHNQIGNFNEDPSSIDKNPVASRIEMAQHKCQELIEKTKNQIQSAKTLLYAVCFDLPYGEQQAEPHSQGGNDHQSNDCLDKSVAAMPMSSSAIAASQPVSKKQGKMQRKESKLAPRSLEETICAVLHFSFLTSVENRKCSRR